MYILQKTPICCLRYNYKTIHFLLHNHDELQPFFSRVCGNRPKLKPLNNLITFWIVGTFCTGLSP